ncbi:LacI family DNA-binding transcriptional regulator [Corynebacterium falsenii]|uniref:LacI family DNA-binding transcriptional regulator n=1 Tax=Corynebacterium falsenii TaxID=108486 RepID=UPI003FD443AB
MARGATIYDVAERAGVSLATVSRVVNRVGNVRPATAERVQKAIDELGYVRDISAQSLARRGSPFVGLLLRDPRNPIYGELLYQVQRSFASIGLQVITVSPSVTRGENFELEGIDTLTGLKPRGLLIATGTVPLSEVAEVAEKIPTVVLLRPVGDTPVSSVSLAEEHSVGDLARVVVQAGHRHIVLVGTSLEKSAVEYNRTQHLREVLAAQGVKVTVSGCSDNKWLEAHCNEFICEVDRSTATCIMASNDIKALVLLEAAQRQGIPVPEDLSITGFDGIGRVVPLTGLTTVRWPVEKVARLAATTMEQLLYPESGAGHIRHSLEGEIIAGATLKILNRRAN